MDVQDVYRPLCLSCHTRPSAMHAPATCPPVNRITETCENITFPQLHLYVITDVAMSASEHVGHYGYELFKLQHIKEVKSISSKRSKVQLCKSTAIRLIAVILFSQKSTLSNWHQCQNNLVIKNNTIKLFFNYSLQLLVIRWSRRECVLSTLRLTIA